MNAPHDTRTFEIAGMHCSSCAMSIDWEIEDIEGVVEARTSYAKARTDVTFDPAKVAESDLVAAIARAGFEVRSNEPAHPSDPTQRTGEQP